MDDLGLFLIVEPRDHAALPYVIGSFQKMKPHWPVYWYHGTESNTEVVLNDPRVNRDKVVLNNLGHKNLTIAMYNELFFSEEFWSSLPHEDIFVIQTDVSYIFDSPHTLDEFRHYDYGGAPWPWEQVAKLGPWRWSGRCGNGGYSFRKRSAMLKCLREGPPRNDNEDVFFSYRCKHLIEVMPARIGARFSYEMMHPYPNPAGAHKGHVYEPRAVFEHPEVRTLQALQKLRDT